MARQAPCLMVQGTGSGVGKSLLTAALCRLFARAGYRVTPFKAQNMALNAAVADGGEIGRAQAAQAEAAGVEPTVDMNPILLKPESDHRSQVIVRGRPLTSADWGAYREMQGALLGIVAESLERLRRTFELVLIEGAGSPAEINLRAHDIVNMRVARLADARVLLVGDIDRGGVFAALVGTLALLDPADRARVAGLIVNKLRGDGSILTPGLDELAARVVAAASAGRSVLGVCGGFQRLGEGLRDPQRVESERAAAVGLGLLPVTTTFSREKTAVRVRARVAASGLLRGAAGSELAAYEIHAGRSEVTRWAPCPFTIVERCGAAVDDPEGAMNARGNVVGTYLHGLFADGALRRSLLCLLAELRGRPVDARWGAPDADRYERLADIVGGALDMPAIAKLAGLPFPRA